LPSGSTDDLRRTIVAMSELVEQNVDTAIMALIDRSDHLANQVVTFERAVNEVDLEIGEMAAYILRHVKESDDEFRFTVTAMRISSLLERISNLSSNIAAAALFLNTRRGILSSVEDMGDMLENTAGMVRDSVYSLISSDSEMAWDVCLRDDVVDECFNRIVAEVAETIRKDPSVTDRAVRIAFAASDLEHIANHACGIAQEVIFLLEGKILRYHLAEHQRIRKEEIASGKRPAPGSRSGPGRGQSRPADA